MYETTGGQNAVAALNAPLGNKLLADRHKHDNWSNTSIRMKICEKPSGFALGKSLGGPSIFSVPTLWESVKVLFNL